MFTPQGKGGWSFTPRSAERTRSLLSNPRSVGRTGFGKGKSVVGVDVPQAPPQGLLGENGADARGSNAEAEVWKQFRDAGMLDEAALEKKDREALLEMIAKLEKELYDYQHNMGLLLIEKKEWTSKDNDFREELAEVEEILKREKAAHLIAISEMEKREENLRKALGVEKQCVNDLENALREMHSKQAEMNITADSKQAESHALKEELREKILEVDAKVRTADAQLLEINRKNSDIERKLQDLASREGILQREQLLLNNEKGLHAEDLARQREDLQSWEKNLCEGQERLVESQKLLLQREKKITENDMALTKKEKEFERLRESVEKANSSLKEKEDYVNVRLTALATKEKELEFQMDTLQKKEQDLHAKEEHLNAKEMVELEKIVASHKSTLALKTSAFEMELAEKRKLVDKELQSKLIDVDKKEREIKAIEEKLFKREQALEKKMKKLNSDKNDLDVKAKALKKWEETLKHKEMEIEKMRKQLSEDDKHLLISRAEIDAERKVIEDDRFKLISEQEITKVTQQEREDYMKLQSKLRQENDECMILKESLAKELKELRDERKNFESEWETLDEKRLVLFADERKVVDEKAGLEKWKCAEELRLKTEKQVARDEMQRELDDLRLRKEAFEANMAHDRSELLEKLRQDRGNMVQELDLRKHELEIYMQRKVQDLENHYQEKETELNEQRMIEMDHIKSLRELAASEMQKLKIEQAGLEREKEEYLIQRKKLKEDQLEMQNDIEMLRSLSRSLKVQRVEFTKEKENLLSQSCKNCGTQAGFVSHLLQSDDDICATGNVSLQKLDDGYLEDRLKSYQTDTSPVANESQSGASGSRISWLKACTNKIFNLSPHKRTENSVEQAEVSNLFVLGQEKLASCGKADELAKPSGFTGLTGTTRAVGEAVRSSDTAPNVLENSSEVNRNEADNHVSEMVSEHDIPVLDGQNEASSLLPLVEEDMETQVESQGLKKNVQHGGKRGRRKHLKRTHSVQAVVEESKVLLNETHGKTGPNSSLNNDVSQGDSIHTGRTTSMNRKRHFSCASGAAASDMDADSEAHSESVSIGGHRKRQVVSDTQTVGERRYNFRRSTVEGKGGAAQAAMGKTKGAKARKPRHPLANEGSQNNSDEQEGISKHEQTFPVVVQENDMKMHMSQRSVADGNVVRAPSWKMVEVQEETTQADIAAYSGQIMEINGDESASILAGQEDEVYATEEGEDWDGDDDNDESDSERHNASIGKKLWKFFTS